MMGKILDFFRPILSGVVLDAGCGSGDFVSAVARLPTVKSCYGLDLSSAAIQTARTAYPDCAFVVGSVLQMPFEDGKFDVILVREVVEHILDTSAMFHELSRCLRPGGYLGITTTDYNLLKKLVIALGFDRYFYPENPHIRFYTKRTLSKSLEKVGCKMVRHEWNGSYFGLMPWGQRIIAQKVADSDLTTD